MPSGKSASRSSPAASGPRRSSSAESHMQKALDHLRVLDLSRVLAGPFLAQNLADFGADVIKVERPGHGDESRTFPPYMQDQTGAQTGDSAY